MDFVNRTFIKIMGYVEKEVLGKSFIQFLHPDERERVMEIYKMRLAGEMVPEFYETRILKKDGSSVFVEVGGNIVEHGGEKADLVFIRDISERKEAEQMLEESEAKFRSLADKSPNMIFINQGGKLIYVNDECSKVMGYSREEFLSPDFDFMDLIGDESKSLVQEKFEEHQRGKDVEPYEYVTVTKDGEVLTVVNTTKLITYEGKKAILGNVTDVTIYRETADKLKETYRELAQKTKELGRINNQLTLYGHRFAKPVGSFHITNFV